MKNKPLIITLIVILSLAVISLITFLIIALSSKKFNLFHLRYRTNTKLVVNEEYDTIFDGINIDTMASEIEIKSHDDEKIVLKIYGEKDKIEYSTDNDELKIKIDEEECKFICFNRKISKIELYLPSTYENDIKIDNNYGDVILESFKNANVQIKMAAGEIKADNLKKANIDNDLGDIELYGNYDDLKITASAGDIEINEVKQVDIDNHYGSTKIKKVTEYLKISGDCGDVKLDEINLTEDSDINLDMGDIKIGKTNEIYIDAKTSLGSVKINNNYRKSEIQLTIENDCGDIKVEN